MPTPQPFATVATELPRDRWGRPLITPPEGGDPVAYQRVTTFVGALEDTYHLSLWSQRMVALGMARRRDLQVAAAAITDPKDRYQKRTLNEIAKSASEAAAGSAAATTGTALHSLTEQIDMGITPAYVPEEFESDLAAYREITSGLAFIDSEGFCVRDDLRVGGSYDRIVVSPEPLRAPDGTDVECAIWDLKGLALTTPLPTPEGWTTMGAVSVGDRVFGSDGQTCTVTAKSATKRIGTYIVTFDDGSEVVCDSEHIWWTAAGPETEPTAKTISEVIATLTNGRQNIHRVPVAGPLDLPEADLPIDPYLLGCWLGDGHVRNGCISKADDLFEILTADGHDLGVRQVQPEGKEHVATRSVVGLTKALRLAGLQHSKHIPAAYLRGSVDQRLRLLQGLMDTDGTWNTARRTAVFYSSDKALAMAVEELVRTLGQRPHFVEYTAHGFGLDVTAYRVDFTPVDINPFRLPRKADQAAASTKSTTRPRRRVIVRVEEGPDVDTACISVDSPNRTYLCGDQMIPTHNTGGSTDGGLFGIGKIAMQLGVYANSVKYDHTLGSRTTLPGSPSLDWGIVCHLPAGSGQAQLLWVDIAAGWETARTLAPGVHAWRKRKDLSQAFRAATARPKTDSLVAQIAEAPSYAALQALHAANSLVWTPGLTSMAVARKAELEAES